MKPDRLALMQTLVDEGKLEWAPMNHSKQSEQTWPVMFDCLRLYCEERQLEQPGTEVSSIPENKRWTHPEGHDVGLGRWMHTQNKQRRAGKLRPDRCAKMQELVDAGIFRWPTQRQFKSGPGAGTGMGAVGDAGYYSDELNGDEVAAVINTVKVSGTKRTGSAVLEARAKRTRLNQPPVSHMDFRPFYDEGDSLLDSAPENSVARRFRDFLSGKSDGADLEREISQGHARLTERGLDSLLSAVEFRAMEGFLKDDSLLLKDGKAKSPAVRAIDEDADNRFRSEQMMQLVGEVQEPLLLRNHSLDLEPGMPGYLGYSFESVGEEEGRKFFRLDSSRQPSFLDHFMATRSLSPPRSGEEVVVEGASAAVIANPEKSSGSDPESTISLELRAQLQAQMLAHIKAVRKQRAEEQAGKSGSSDRYTSLMALAHVAEEEVLSRNNSADSGDGNGGIFPFELSSISRDELFSNFSPAQESMHHNLQISQPASLITEQMVPIRDSVNADEFQKC